MTAMSIDTKYAWKTGNGMSKVAPMYRDTKSQMNEAHCSALTIALPASKRIRQNSYRLLLLHHCDSHSNAYVNKLVEQPFFVENRVSEIGQHKSRTLVATARGKGEQAEQDGWLLV